MIPKSVLCLYNTGSVIHNSGAESTKLERVSFTQGLLSVWSYGSKQGAKKKGDEEEERKKRRMNR